MRVQLATGMKAVVTDVDSEAVTINANHPMAGKAFEMTAELTAPPQPASEVLETATFAGGCFWGLECASAGLITHSSDHSSWTMALASFRMV